MLSRLPEFAHVDRSHPEGMHPYLALLPHAAQSPAMRRITPSASAATELLENARVMVAPGRGYAYVDVNTPCIVLSEWYYRSGSATRESTETDDLKEATMLLKKR